MQIDECVSEISGHFVQRLRLVGANARNNRLPCARERARANRMGRIPHRDARGRGWRCHHDRGYASVMIHVPLQKITFLLPHVAGICRML